MVLMPVAVAMAVAVLFVVESRVRDEPVLGQPESNRAEWRTQTHLFALEAGSYTVAGRTDLNWTNVGVIVLCMKLERQDSNEFFGTGGGWRGGRYGRSGCSESGTQQSHRW